MTDGDPFRGPRFFNPGDAVAYWFHERGKWQMARYSADTVAACDSAAIRFISLRAADPSTIRRAADAGYEHEVELWRRINWPTGSKAPRGPYVKTYYGPAVGA